MPKNLRYDEDVMKLLISKHPIEFKHYQKNLYKLDQQFIKEAILKYPHALQFVSNQFYDNRDIILSAVKKNPRSIHFASERYLIIIALKTYPYFYIHIPTRNLTKKEFERLIIPTNGKIYSRLSDNMKTDFEILMKCAYLDVGMMQYVPKNIMSIREN
eukprot:gene8287-111_t